MSLEPRLTYEMWSKAACIGKWFLFEEDYETEDGYYPHEAEAKAICATCPVRVKCLKKYKGLDGMIVGGLTDKERRRLWSSST